jgi:hypothetical protein
MVYLLGCLPPGGCHTGALVRALGRHGKLVPLRNADLCSTAALRLIRPKSKQPKRLAPKSFQVQLRVEKMSAFVLVRPVVGKPPRGPTGLNRRALGRHGKLVPLRNADLCSTAALRLIRPKSKQPKRLTPKSRSVQLNAKKNVSICQQPPKREPPRVASRTS